MLKISVVTPSFNQGKYIREAIQSVLDQDYPDFEHIVADGGSTDETVEVLSSFPHPSWVSEKDKGQTEALNKCLKKATGDIIAWLNSDDYYLPGAFRAVADYFSANPEVMIVLGDCVFYDQSTGESRVVVNRDLNFEDLIRFWDNYIPPTQPSIFFRAELLREFGFFDENLHLAMDYEYWLRVALKYDFRHMPTSLAVYRFHSESKSGTDNDWTRFYPEWFKVYCRYKQYSKILPSGPLLSVAVPLSRKLEEETGNHYALVNKLLESIRDEVVPDAEVLIITDLDEDKKIIELDLGLIRHKIIRVKYLNQVSFIQAIKRNATGFGLHCPSLVEPLPAWWYFDCLKSMFSDHALKFVERKEFSLYHPFLSEQSGLLPCYFRRTDTICTSDLDNAWSVFYPEVYSSYLDYRKVYRLAPGTPLLTLALPLSRKMEEETGRHFNQVNKLLEHIRDEVIPDAEVLVVTDLDVSLKMIEMNLGLIRHKVVRVKSLGQTSFVQAIREYATGLVLHCPSLVEPLPEWWYFTSLKSMFEDTKLKYIEREEFTRYHPFLNDNSPLLPCYLTRTADIFTNELTFSVIIPTYNRREILLKCLDALERQTFSQDKFEVVICDDGSTDDTEEAVGQLKTNFLLTYLRQKNAGPAKARNMGIRRARGKYLFILNDDAILIPDAMDIHYQVLCDKAGEKISVLGRFSFPPEYVQTPFTYLLDKTEVLFYYNQMKHGEYYDFNHFYTCNISIPRQDVLNVGLFDEEYDGPAAEDIDLGYRLEKLGYRIYYRADCIAWHHHRITPEGFCRVHKVRGRGAITFMAKHPDSMWYWGHDFSKTEAWREEIAALRLKAVFNVELIHETDKMYLALEEKNEHLLRDFAQELKQKVEFLRSYHEKEGFLGNPMLPRLVELRTGKKQSRIEKDISKSDPLVSIIVYCCDHEHLIGECVDTVFSQTFKDYEVIFIDACSYDESIEGMKYIRHSFCDFRTRLMFNASRGNPAACFNTGIKAARGRYILPLIATDRLCTMMLVECIKTLEANPGYSFAYTDYTLLGTEERVISVPELSPDVQADFSLFPYCFLFEKKMWEDIQGYMVRKPWPVGCSMFLRMALDRGFSGIKIPKVLFKMSAYQPDEGVAGNFAAASDAESVRDAQPSLPCASDAESREATDASSEKEVKTSLPVVKPEPVMTECRMPMISVVVAGTSPANLRNCLDSVAGQGVSPLEVIVCVPGLKAGKAQEKRHPGVKFVMCAEGGLSSGIVNVLEEARGDIIVRLSPERELLPDALEVISRTFLRPDCARMYVSDEIVRDEKGVCRDLKRKPMDFEDLISFFAHEELLLHPAFFFKKELLSEFPPDASSPFPEYDFLLKLSAREKIRVIYETLTRLEVTLNRALRLEAYKSAFAVFSGHRRGSRVLPKTCLVTVALPFFSWRISRNPKADELLVSTVREALDLPIQDVEILVLTDMQDVEKRLSGFAGEDRIRILRLSGRNAIKYVENAIELADGFAFYCVSPARAQSFAWFKNALQSLLGDPRLSEIRNAGLPHVVVTDEESDLVVSSDMLYRTQVLKDRLTGLKPPQLAHGAAYKISVVIPTFNRAPILKQCLEALIMQDYPHKLFEVVVCDDASTDETDEMLKTFKAPYRLVRLRQKSNRGPAAARNRAIKSARGEYVLIINDDTLLDRQGVSTHVRLCDQFSVRKLAILGKFTVPEKFRRTILGFLFERSDLLFAYCNMHPRRIYNHCFFYTCNISLPRQALIDAGLFEEYINGAGAEDIELGYRLEKIGWKILYAPECKSGHEHLHDAGAFINVFRVRGGGGVILFLKHPELPVHYHNMDESALRRWREGNPMLTQALEMIVRLLDIIQAKFEVDEQALVPVEGGVEVTFPLALRDGKEGLFQWYLSPHELLKFCISLAEGLNAISDSPGPGLTLEQLDEVYRVLNFLKWHFDTVAVVNSPYIEKYLAKMKSEK